MVITIPLNNFLRFVELVKVAKSNLIFIQNDKIFSIDESLSCVKQITSLSEDDNFSDFNFMCNGGDLSSFVKSINISNILTDLITLDYNAGIIYAPSNQNECIKMLNDVRVSNTINGLISTLSSTPNVLQIGSIKTDESFTKATSLKSSDGMGLYRHGKYIMSIFSGLLPINKSDDVHLTIFDLGCNSFISNFKIMKKKKMIVDVFIKYLKLD